MSLIPENLYPGAPIKLHAFGPATVRRVYTHADTGETCADVKADSGEITHLSLAYVRRLLNE